MRKGLIGSIIIIGTCIGSMLAGFLSSRKGAEMESFHLPPHSVLLTIDEVNTGKGLMYQATVIDNDTQWISPPLINSRDLNKLFAREGNIYTNKCIGAHEKLFQSLRMFIDSTIPLHDTIYTILNGLSWNLAIEAIPMDSNDEYLCDRYYIKRISSTKQINNQINLHDTHKSILFGDVKYNSSQIKDLTGSKHAIAYLRELYSDKENSVEIYSQDAATMEAFLAVSGRSADNMLVSTHGVKRVLSGRSNTYELLFDNAIGVPADKIAKMDLSHIQTIFTTACHSGYFSSHSNECLCTALKKACANSLILHIWRTNDNAAEIFINSYYSAWLSGHTPREAFCIARNAIRTYRDHKGILLFEDPQYWAGFVMLD